MRVNEKTLLFEDLNDEEARQLRKIAEDCVFHGKLTTGGKFAWPWQQAGKFTDDQMLVVGSTLFPMRALYSLLLRVEAKYEYLNQVPELEFDMDPT